ncbi:MAG TPA: SurA N-terminal domain-containing protein [Vicinamibacteria bacterium]|nr:SurA N-terminal domain-containing protein [Vicinamibacteria bacterium]
MTKTRRSAVLLALVLAACSRPAAAPAPSPAAPSPPASVAAADPGRPLPSPLPEIVARVNGQPIRLRQILPMTKASLGRLPAGERESWAPETLRSALQQYVDRELLLQEALARGVKADAREVDWAYDQLRREHPDEQGWSDFLAGQGLDPQSIRTELRAQHTVTALLEQEAAGRPGGLAEARAALVARLRARARVEILI